MSRLIPHELTPQQQKEMYEMLRPKHLKRKPTATKVEKPKLPIQKKKRKPKKPSLQKKKTIRVTTDVSKKRR